MEAMTAMILAIALEVGVPPNFALAVALTENDALKSNAVSKPNANGTRDLGIMQLNSANYGAIDWRNPEVNIRAGCWHIRALMERVELSTYWEVAVAYNCGMKWKVEGFTPPKSSLNYATAVMKKWTELEGGYVHPIIGKLW